MAASPQTGHQTAEASLVNEALALFFEHPGNLLQRNTTGGVNNICLQLHVDHGNHWKRYILRIYNNGNNSAKVAFEHDILAQLQAMHQNPATKLSFEVPNALLSLNGRVHELLSSGAECCVFHFITGQLASTTSPEEVGRATGELSVALGQVKVNSASPTPPYYDLFNAHHAIGGNCDLFYSTLATHPAMVAPMAPAAVSESILYLAEQIRALETKLDSFRAWNLPVQIIHGDLHYDNVMVIGDTVSGLLDFEFCALDWRAMELAVALSKYISEADPLPFIASFARGYAQRDQRLTDAELDALPDLVTLRILSNVVYFTGRALAGEDAVESLTSRTAAYARRVRWLQCHADEFRATLRRVMRPESEQQKPDAHASE